MNIDQLFCTPEQGRRLQELVPGLTSALVWAHVEEGEPVVWRNVGSYYSQCPPALTLQELRTEFLIWFWNGKGDKDMFRTFKDMMLLNTAPELAAWVIERLEEATP